MVITLFLLLLILFWGTIIGGIWGAYAVTGMNLDFDLQKWCSTL